MKSFFKKYKIQISCLLLIAVIIYGRTINYEFAIDDRTVITQNKFIQHNDIQSIITTTYWEGYADEIGAVYRPIPLISYVFTNLTIGNSAKAHHFINVLLWCITLVVLLFFLMQYLLTDINKWLITLGVILWSVLPISIEAIANIKGRDDILALLFSLIALISIMKILLGNKELKYNISLGVFIVLAMFSKETAIIFFPFIVLLFFLKKAFIKEWKTLLIVLLSYFLALIIRGIITFDYVEVNLPENNMVMMFKGVEKIFFQLHLILMYFIKLVFPFNLTWDYSLGYFEIKNYLIEAIVSVLLIIFFAYSFLKGLRNKSFATLFIILYLSGILLVSNVFFLSGSTFAERFLFIPSLGIILWLIQYIAENKKLYAYKYYILLSLITFYGITTSIRVSDWSTEEKLIISDYSKPKKSFRTETAYLDILITKYKSNTNNIQLREQVFQLSKSLQNRFPNIESVWNLSGDYYKLVKNYIEAEKCFIKSKKINPNSYAAFVNLGFINQELNKFDEALDYYKKAIMLNPNSHIPYSNIGIMLHNQNKFIEAKKYYIKSLEINPKNPSIQQNLQNVNNAINLYKLN